MASKLERMMTQAATDDAMDKRFVRINSDPSAR